jgi:hypothetical protein
MAEQTPPQFQLPRSTQAFGVASILSDNCRVFYDSLFTTRHLGRIADLLAARLQKAGPDELRLRTLILFLSYEGFRCQFPVELEDLSEEEEERALASPLTVECGVDDEKIAIGVSFLPHASQKLDLIEVADRIRAGTPANRIERTLMQLLRFSGQVFYRYQKNSGRVELIALTGIGQLAKVNDPQGLLEIHEIPAEPETAPRAMQYSELGDEAYEKLLKDEQKGRGSAQEDLDREQRLGEDEDEEEGRNRLGKDDPRNKDKAKRFGSKKRVVGSKTVGADDLEDELEDQAAASGSSADDEDANQKVNGRDPVRKGRMKVGAQEEDEEVAPDDDEDARLGKDSARRRMGSFGVKSSEENTDIEEDSDGDDEIRMGRSSQKTSSRKIGVKGASLESEEADGAEDEDLSLGKDGGSQRAARSREEQRADAKAIRDFDDSDINPNQVTPEQIERYKDQIQRMSRRLMDLEEDRAKWMRMVKAGQEPGKSSAFASDQDQPGNSRDGVDDGTDELKLKRIQDADGVKGDLESEEDEQELEKKKSREELRVKKLEGKKVAEKESAEQDLKEDSPKQKEKKKPVSFLKRLFGGGEEQAGQEASKSEVDEGSTSDAKNRAKSPDDESSEKKRKKKGFFGSDEESSDEAESKSGSTGDSNSETDETDDEDLKVKSDDPGEKADELVKEMESGTFHAKMSKSKEELDAIRDRIKDERVKAWADGMMSEIMREKARLAEMARSLNQSVRAKEADFNRKAQYLKQEVLNREEQIRKAQLATTRVREQLSLVNSSSERLKVQISNLETQEAAGRQKVQASERLLQVAKEETQAAQRLAENLKSQLAQSGSAAKKVELVQKELLAAKAQTEKAVKQLDDLKKLNSQLTEKLTAATQSTSGAGGTEDLKRKLEAAGRLTAVHKKEAETFKSKMETSIKEEARLRSEVTKLQAEVKRMKTLSEMNASAAARKPGGSGGKAA